MLTLMNTQYKQRREHEDQRVALIDNGMVEYYQTLSACCEKCVLPYLYLCFMCHAKD